MLRARITGTGSAVPDKVLTNHDLEKLVDTNDEWITTRTGINNVVLLPRTNILPLLHTGGTPGSCNAGVRLRVDLIILGTVTPDFPFPPRLSCSARVGAHQLRI